MKTINFEKYNINDDKILERTGEFVPFKIVQHFIAEIDKIKVEVI